MLIHKSNFKVFVHTAIQAASTLGYTTTFSYLTIQRFATLHVGMVEHVLPLMYASVLVNGKGLPVRLVRAYLVTSLSLCTKQLVYTASIPGCLIKLLPIPAVCDPPCVHGTCQNGACQCAEGWRGNLCQERKSMVLYSYRFDMHSLVTSLSYLYSVLPLTSCVHYHVNDFDVLHTFVFC